MLTGLHAEGIEMASELRAARQVSLPELVRTGHIESLDGLRAIAALMVLTGHVAFYTGAVTTPFLGPIFSRMDLGVCLFFLLSGYLLYRPWARSAMTGTPPPRTRDYARKRIARIYPAYFAVVVVVLGVYPPVRVAPLGDWLHYLTLTQTYASGQDVEQLTQMWSLATEAAFYLVLPLLGWAVGRQHRGEPDRSARRQWAMLATMVAAAFVFNVVRAWTTWLPEWLATFWLPGFLDWFALGMGLALVRARLELEPLRRPSRVYVGLRSVARDVVTCLIVAFLLYAVACTPVAGRYSFAGEFGPEMGGPWAGMVKHYLYGAVAFFLLLPLVLGPRDSTYGRALASPAMQLLGKVSYGVFLWHLLLLSVIANAIGLALFGGGFVFLWPLAMSASIAVAAISWRFLERPILDRTHRSTSRPLQASPAP